MEFNALTATLNAFIAVFSQGYVRLQPAIDFVLFALLVIEVAITGAWTALGGGAHLSQLFRKLLYLGFWFWIVRSFPELSKAFVESLIDAGLIAGGQPGNHALLLDPSTIAARGLDATDLLALRVAELGFSDLPSYLVLGTGLILIVICYFMMALNVFMAVLEYYLFIAVCGLLMPFGVLQATKFLAEKAIAAVVAAGIKLMVLAFVLAVTDPVIAALKFNTPKPGANEVWGLLLTLSACTYLTWHAPRLASSLLAGSPSLGVGDAASSATGAGGVAAIPGQTVMAQGAEIRQALQRRGGK